MAVIDSKFSQFINGGDLIIGDTVVGLRDGLNTRFINTGGVGMFLPLAGGTMSGAINMNSSIVYNLPAPSAGGDATNKTYVDGLIAGASPLTTKGDLYSFTTVNARLAVGAINGQMLQVNSATATGLAWSTATYPVTASTAGKILQSDGTNFVQSTPTYPSASGSAGKIIRSDGTNNVYSTATFSDTYTANNLLYSNGANTVTGLATANNGVLITSAGGVPSISSTLPSAVQTNITALGAQSQALDMNSHLINNVTDPVSTQDAATKNYVDKTALNGTSVYAASAATLGTVTQSGAGVGATLTNAGVQATFALDGVSPLVGVNVLIKNTATGMAAANEGIYTVTSVGSGATNWVLTRATSYDTATEINNTGLILVQNGSTLVGTAWYNSATIVTVDTTAFSYTQFGNITFPVTLANGGTSASLTASNGGIFYSTATAGAILSGTATAGQMLQSGASSAPAWSTATYPATAGTAGKILISDGTNYITSTSLWPNTVGTAGKIIRSDGTTNTYTTATYPTIATSTGSFLYADGTNWVASTSLWPNTVGTSGKVVVSNGTTNVYSTPTFPNASATSGKIIQSDGTNWIASTPTLPSVATSTGSFIYADGTNFVASTSLWPNTVGSTGKIVRSNGTSNAYTTATYPDTAGTSGNVLTSDGTNWNSTAPPFASNSFNQTVIQVFTSTGTYTPTAGMKYCIAEGVAGGGGGGGTGASAAAQIAIGGGGGGGSYSRVRLTAAQVGVSQTVTIGAAGAAGANTGGTGGTGGVTSLGTLLTTNGGIGGNGGTTAASAVSSGGSGGSSTSTTGDLTIEGGGGGMGLGFVITGISGFGGSSMFSGQKLARAISGGSNAGATGLSYGGGGCGAGNANTAGAAAGGAGAPGLIIVTEFISV